MKTRSPGHRGKIIRPLTGLLSCEICGATLWRYHHPTNRPTTFYWRCPVGLAAHVCAKNHIIMANLAAELLRQIKGQSTELRPTQDSASELESLMAQRARIGDAYTAGLFNLDEFSRRAQDIDAQIAFLEQARADESEQATAEIERTRVIGFLTRMTEAELLDWLNNGDKAAVNTALRRLLSKVVIGKGGVVVRLEI